MPGRHFLLTQTLQAETQSQILAAFVAFNRCQGRCRPLFAACAKGVDAMAEMTF